MIEPTNPGREHRLNAALADYFSEIEAGRRPDRDAFLARYPDVAAELASFFADKDRFDHLAEPLQPITTSGEPPRVRYVGDYELLAEIGRGGMGIVYKARQATLQREVAVKMILAGHLASATDVERFKAEARAAGGLDHPHIVPIYEIGAWKAGEVGPSLHYFSMKLIEGGSLAQQLPRFMQDAKGSAKLLATVARAVHHAHERGLLHRDLKPANILIDSQGQPYVTDFGLSRRTGGGETQTGVVLGTPSYMAPEQAMGQTRGLTLSADVWSLGAMLYELLTGQPPFKGDSPLEVLFKVKSDEPKLPRSLNPKVNRDLETIALKCLQKEPRKRYASALELAEDLDRFVAGEPIKARGLGFWGRACRRPGRGRIVFGLVVGGAVMGLLFLLCAGTLSWSYTEAGMVQVERAEAEHARMLAMEAERRLRAQAAALTIPDMKDLTWETDALWMGQRFRVLETHYDGDKGVVTWRLEASYDNVPTAPLKMLHARFLDAKNGLLKKVELEGVKGEGVLLKRGETVTISLKLPEAEVRKQTAKVVIATD
jgi:hypothetical protein